MLSTLHQHYNIMCFVRPNFPYINAVTYLQWRVKIFVIITLPKLPFPSTVRKLKSDDLMTSCRVVELGIFGGSLRSVLIDSCLKQKWALHFKHIFICRIFTEVLLQSKQVLKIMYRRTETLIFMCIVLCLAVFTGSPRICCVVRTH